MFRFFAHDIEIKTTPPTDAALQPASTAVRGTIATEAVGSVAAMSAAASSASSVGGENFLVGPIELSIASIVLHLVGVGATQASAGPKCKIWGHRILHDRAKDGNTEKMWNNSGRKKPHKTLKIRAGKMAVMWKSSADSKHLARR